MPSCTLTVLQEQALTEIWIAVTSTAASPSVAPDEPPDCTTETLGLAERCGLTANWEIIITQLSILHCRLAAVYCELLPEQLTQILGRKGLFPLSIFLNLMERKENNLYLPQLLTGQRR